MNLRTWLNDQLRNHTKPTAAELAQQQAALDARYRQGRLDERYALLAQLAKEQQATIKSSMSSSWQPGALASHQKRRMASSHTWTSKPIKRSNTHERQHSTTHSPLMATR